MNLGKVLAGTKRQTKAVEFWTHALSIYEELVRRFPTNDDHRAGVAECRYCLGEAYEQSGEKAKSQQFYRQAVGLFEELAKRSRRKGAYQDQLAHCHFNLAVQLMNDGRDRDADLAFRRAAEHLQELMASHPKEPQYRFHLAICHSNLGAMLRDRGQKKEAQAEYAQALAVDPENLFAASNLVWQMCIAADVSVDDTKRAGRLARMLVRKAPENGVNQRCLGMACYRAGDWTGAIAAFQTAAKLHEGLEAVDAFFVAMALQNLGKQGVARKCYDLGSEWLATHESEVAKSKVFADELSRLRAESARVLGIQVKKSGR